MMLRLWLWIGTLKPAPSIFWNSAGMVATSLSMPGLVMRACMPPSIN